jgi:hypothetical protein
VGVWLLAFVTGDTQQIHDRTPNDEYTPGVAVLMTDPSLISSTPLYLIFSFDLCSPARHMSVL